MRCLNFFSLLFIVILLQACGGGGGGGAALSTSSTTSSTPVSSLTVSWDYYDASYLIDYNIDGVKVYVGDTEVCSTANAYVLTAKTMSCDVSSFSLSTPFSFTLTAYDKDGYESPKSEVFTIS